MAPQSVALMEMARWKSSIVSLWFPFHPVRPLRQAVTWSSPALSEQAGKGPHAYPLLNTDALFGSGLS